MALDLSVDYDPTIRGMKVELTISSFEPKGIPPRSTEPTEPIPALPFLPRPSCSPESPHPPSNLSTSFRPSRPVRSPSPLLPSSLSFSPSLPPLLAGKCRQCSSFFPLAFSLNGSSSDQLSAGRGTKILCVFGVVLIVQSNRSLFLSITRYDWSSPVCVIPGRL